jgi:LuxR family maltose regulon positive regulatory protein
MLAQIEQSARQKNFMLRMPEIAAAQILVLLKQEQFASAAQLAETYQLPICQARVLLAQGDPAAALAVLGAFRQQVEAKEWQDERLKAMVLQAVALHMNREKEKALQVLSEALALAEPGGFIRIFVDEGQPMARLLSEAAARGIMPDYTGKLLAAFEAEERKSTDKPGLPPVQPLVEPLSQRELEVLRLIVQGLSNHEIGERLCLALDTVKGHNRRIYDKLQVQRRTEAAARARELGLL